MNRELIKTRLQSAVWSVGKFIQQERETFSSHHIEYKGKNNLVSYVDRNAEERLMHELSDLIPGCGFINEESGQKDTNNDFVWVIDPLDGTTNFIHGLPVFSVSVALLVNQELTFGCVYEINRDELFYAEKGAGAFLNGKPIHISPVQNLSECLIATGFPYADLGYVDAFMNLMKDFMGQAHGLRRLGSAAVDLAYTAAGRFDGFFESRLNAWDIAAGALLVQEAGGVVRTYKNEESFLFGKSIVAANPVILEQMLQVLRKHLNA